MSAWLGSYDDVAEHAVVGTRDGDGALLVRARRTPYLGDALDGQALVLVAGETGYVVEFWGDALSFAQTEPQLNAVLQGFVALSGS